MAKKPDFDTGAAHKHFSAECFNRAWDLMEMPSRTAEEDEQMIRLNQASIWHWTQRPDCKRSNLSVGYWQASRIHSVLRHATEARKYGQLSLDFSQGEDPFYSGYAYEALARAESVAGDDARMKEHLAEAKRIAETVTDPDSKKMLLDDLATIG
jgi:hypothetical protein